MHNFLLTIYMQINDRGKFGKSFLEIYPTKFIKLGTSVNKNIFVYKLFNERDTLPFAIVRIPQIDKKFYKILYFP